MKKIIIFESEKIKEIILTKKDFGLDFFVSNTKNQKELLKIILKNKAEAGIFITEDFNTNLSFRKLGSWDTVHNFDLDLLYLESIDAKPSKPSAFSNAIPFGKKTESLSFGERGIMYSEDQKIDSTIFKIGILKEDDFKGKMKSFNDKYGYFKIGYKKCEDAQMVSKTVVFNAAQNGKTLPGMGKFSSFNNEENHFSFTNNNSIFDAKLIDGFWDILYLTKGDDQINTHYFHNGIGTNFINNICDNKVNDLRKIKKSEWAISIVGLIVFIILTVITFRLILDPGSVKDSWTILFDQYTFQHVWIYLLWVNFFISYLQSFIVMYIIGYAVNKKRPNLKMLLNFFIAGQIKATARFITGEAIIGTIIWGWYLTKKNNIRTSKLVGSVASLSLIAACVNLMFGLPFMIIGQVYLVRVFSSIAPVLGEFYTPGGLATFYALSWGGFIWNFMDGFIRVAVIYWSFTHLIYNKIYTQIILIKKNPNVFDNMTNREFSLMSLKSQKPTKVLSRERIIRLSIMVFVSVFIEALELMYIFNIVEMYNNPSNPVMTFNFLNISGGRYMVANVRNFPALNLVPGEGMGFVEYFMSNIYESFYIFSHANVSGLDAVDLGQAKIFADQTTFITRFFNSYLHRIISFTITIYVVGKLLRRKNRDRNKIL